MDLGFSKASGRAYLLGDGARRRRNGGDERERQRIVQDERGSCRSGGGELAGEQEDDRWPVGSGGVGGD